MATGENGNDNSNGRVTLALLKQTQEATNALLRDFIVEQRKFNELVLERLRQNELGCLSREERLKTVQQAIEDHDKSIEDLKTSENRWKVINGVIAAAVSAVIGVFRQ